MIPLFAVLPLLPQVSSVCPVGCPYATLQKAVDDVPENGSTIIGIDVPILDAATVIDGGREVTLVPYLTFQEVTGLLQALQAGDLDEALEVLGELDTVTLTHSAPTGAATLTVNDATLNIVGLAIDGGLGRAIDATDAQLSLSVSTVFGRGVTADGGLLRLRGGQLDVIGGGFREGSAASEGGLVAIYDADATIQLTSFSDGSASQGACLFVAASDPAAPHTVTLSQATFQSCDGSLSGGAVHLEGALTAEISATTFQDSSAADGGAMALVGPDLTATLTECSFDSCQSFDQGGSIFVDDAQLTVTDSGVRRSSSFYGGGIASQGDSELILIRSVVQDNAALIDGGGVHVQGGSYRAEDTLLQANSANQGDGGGLWIGGDALWAEDLRTTACGNVAITGGGIRVSLDEPTVVHNLRLLDNLADLDGGGLFHSGADLELSFANLLGNSAGRGSGAAALTTGELTLQHATVAYNLGSVAVVPRTGASVLIGPTLWFGNERGDLDGLSPTAPGALFIDPLLDRYVPGDNCQLVQDWPTWNSPSRDAGSPSVEDLDGTRADIGAYGGPEADPTLWNTDRDEDGSPQIYDCDEGNPNVNPEAYDEPYDGIDADCRSDDDFDADRDGFRRILDGGTDCDDTRADIYPGAPEDPISFDDANCDGLLDADGDGFERRSTLDETDGEEDCDDSDPQVYPGAPELGSDADYNCDGFVDGPRIYGVSGCQVAPGWPAWPLARRR